jgi:hypothetical protein
MQKQQSQSIDEKKKKRTSSKDKTSGGINQQVSQDCSINFEGGKDEDNEGEIISIKLDQITNEEWKSKSAEKKKRSKHAKNKKGNFY